MNNPQNPQLQPSKQVDIPAIRCMSLPPRDSVLTLDELEYWLERYNVTGVEIGKAIRNLIGEKYRTFYVLHVEYPQFDDKFELKERGVGHADIACLDADGKPSQILVIDVIAQKEIAVEGRPQQYHMEIGSEVKLRELRVEESDRLALIPGVAVQRERFRVGKFKDSLDPAAVSAQLKVPSGLLNFDDLVGWFTANAAAHHNLDQAETVARIIKGAQSVNTLSGVRYFVNLTVPAQAATLVAGHNSDGARGVLDVIAVHQTPELPRNRQVAMFSFSTSMLHSVIPQNNYAPATHEMIIEQLKPNEIRFTKLDNAEDYTFKSLSNLFKQVDPEGAERLNAYQLELRKMIAKMHQFEPNLLGMHVMREVEPWCHHDTGDVRPGQLNVLVYAVGDRPRKLLEFKIVTGLQSTGPERLHEIIQDVVCPMYEKFEARVKENTDAVRAEIVGVEATPAEASAALGDLVGEADMYVRTRLWSVMKAGIMGACLSIPDSTRIVNTCDFLTNMFGDEDDSGHVFTLNMDGEGLYINIDDADGNNMQFMFALAQ